MCDFEVSGLFYGVLYVIIWIQFHLRMRILEIYSLLNDLVMFRILRKLRLIKWK